MIHIYYIHKSKNETHLIYVVVLFVIDKSMNLFL